MVVVELKGGLGNQMFQYACGRHLAIINNTQLCLDTYYLNNRKPRKNFTFRDFNLDIFSIEADFAPIAISKKYSLRKNIFRKILNKAVQPKPLAFIEEKDFAFSSEILMLPDNIYLNGYWQSEKYFNAISETIRKDFMLKFPLPSPIEKINTTISNCNAVCLHVRRGDFINHPTHGTLGMDYYGKAALLISQKVINPVFYIFSDDIDWCKKNISLPNKVFYIDDEFSAEKSRGHFALMTACKHFIIPNSSFGWWAAWLCKNPDKIVIAPKIWFHDSIWNTKDILPSNWITL